MTGPGSTLVKASASRSHVVRTRLGRRHYLERGRETDPPVILLHGLGSLAEEVMAPLGGPLLAAGFRVLAIDRPGYGLSQAAPRAVMGASAQADDLAELISSLHLRNPIVVGHSAGAAPAVHLARRANAGVGGLVLVNPFCRPTRPRAALGLRTATAPLIGPVVRRVLPRFAKPLGRKMVSAALRPGQPIPSPEGFPWRRMAQPSAVCAMADELRAFNADMIWMRTRLKDVRAPTVILADRQDPVIDGPAHARWLSHRLPVHAMRWSTGGHLTHHAEPAEVVDAVLTVDVARQVGMRHIA